MMALSNDQAVRRARMHRTKHEQSVARNAAQDANIRTRKIGRRGDAERRVLEKVRVGDYEVYLHVTKGWRRCRVTPMPTRRTEKNTKTHPADTVVSAIISHTVREASRRIAEQVGA